MRRYYRAAGLAVFAVSLLAAPWVCGGEGALPDVARAAESRFVHRNQLLDEKGNAITAESTVPYSPKATCSSSRCHDYGVACRGTHTTMFPAAKYDPAHPSAHVWTQFDGSTGIAAPLSHGAFAADPAAFDPKEHMTPFSFATLFGAFHPGGGRLELDSTGVRYTDRLAGDEKPDEADPDYAKARWDESGVLENDCLACHALRGYDHTERAEQLNLKNFKWAATVGAGFGMVEGRGDARKVKYNPALFDAEGSVYMDIGRPTDQNCLYCHRRPARGETTWRDHLDADVHSQSGLRCVDCHACGPDHVMAGDSRVAATEYESLTCVGCHEAGRLGAPIPEHPGLPRLHFDALACEACHSGPRPRPTPLVLEQPVDPTWGVILTSHKAAGPAVYAPVLVPDASGKIAPKVRLLPAFYANRTEKGLVPIKPRSVVSRFRRLKKDIKDDDGDGEPEVNTDAEILAILKAQKRKGVDPVYLAGGQMYGLDEKEALTKTASELADPLDRKLAHNVRPAGQSLGAEGCQECHRSGSPFFLSLLPRRAVGADGKPEGQTLLARLGRSETDLGVAGFRETYIRPFAPVAIAAVVLLMALHYVLFGPRRFERTVPEDLVQRFGWFSRLTHFTLLGSFVVLAVTGLMIAAGMEWILGLGTECVHDTASWALVGAAAVAFILWVKDMFLSKTDIGWIKVLGGYLGYKGHVPAGRFNAGQKFFFWLICLIVACLGATGWMIRYEWMPHLRILVYTLHETCSYLMIVCVLGHAYLGSLANPGTLASVFNGKVPRTWLEHHHPDYAAKQEPEA